MNKTLVVALGLVVGTSSMALAQPHEEAVHRKSPRTATALAVAGSLVGPAMIATGFAMGGGAGDDVALAGLGAMVVAPSAGHLYAGSYRGSLKAMGVRALGGVALGMGAAIIGAGAVGGCAAEGCTSTGGGGGGAVGGVLVLGGLAGVIGGTIYELVDSGNAARRWNHTHVDVSPMVIQTTQSTTLAFGASGSF